MTYAVDLSFELGPASSGLTLLATIKTMAGAAFVSGVGGWTEDPAGSGVYWGTISNFADGVSYRIQWFNGATLMATSPVSPSDARIPAVVTATVDLAALATAMVAALGGAPVTISSPVASSGNVEIVRGDDYANADGRALEWTNPAGTWPDLTGADILLTARQFGATWTKAGTVIVPTGAGQKVRVELTAEDATISPNDWELQLKAVLAGSERVVTLAFSTLDVRANLEVVG